MIPNFEYDIFISYRHNDNLPSLDYGRQASDGWVTQFVDHLQKELRATIKDSISVYFDTNPHDGLSAHHDVDDSLREKLRCLIFIPIVSHTYCDTNSFAWKNEFVAFVNQAQNDTFGLKVKLPNGNVASRVLPLRIHDIDKDDITLFESVTGSIMRPIDLIYKSTGVNRPLLENDKKEENNNHALYRDQVNMVANAIDEILKALRADKTIGSSAKSPLHISDASIRTNKKPSSVSARKKVLVTLFAILVIVLGFWLVNRFEVGNQNQTEEVIDKSIAVLPFTDISDGHDQAYFSDGMMIEILDHLFKIKDLRIIPRNSTLAYKDSSKPLKEIASELGVAHLIQGSVRKSGNRVKISVQLISGIDEQFLWQQTYDRDLADVFAVQSDVASQVVNALNVQITPEAKKRIEAIPTKSKEAYELYLKGRKEYTAWSKDFNMDRVKSGIGFLKSAISLDSTFSNAYAALGNCYWVLGHHDPDYTPDHWLKSKEYSNKAIELDPQNGWAYNQLAVVQNDWEWDRKAAYSSYRKS